MTGDAFLTEPAGAAGRAIQAGTLDQEFDSGSLYALRAAVQAHAGQAGLSEDRASDVVLAVHELAANAITHGAGRGRLRLWAVDGTLSCEIVDGGPPGNAGSPQTAAPWPVTDGHGLWLIRQVADRLDLRSGPHGTRAVITFTLPPDGSGPELTRPITGSGPKVKPRPTTGERTGVRGVLGGRQAWRSRSLSSASMSI
jgi:anti-sigma regulatory factor (Ser/Thr protein kinase)